MDALITNSDPLLSMKLVDEINLEKLDLNSFLSLVFRNLTYQNMYLVPLCIRLGVDSNLYFKTDKGKLHLLVYFTTVSKNKMYDLNLYKYVVLMLLLLGSNYNDMATLDDNVTVKEMIINTLEFPYYDLEENIDTVDRDMLIMVDIPDFMKSFNTHNKKTEDILSGKYDLNYKLMFQSLSYQVAKSITLENSPNINIDTNGESLIIYLCIEFCNFNFFKIMFDKGFKVNYFSMNHIIYNYKKSKENYEKSQYEEMLLYAIERGLQMDLYQLNYIDSPVLIETINKIYSKPEWEKLCSDTHDVTRDQLLRIVKSLDLDFSMNERQICNKIRSLQYMTEDEFLGEDIENHNQYMMDHMKDKYDFIAPVKCENGDFKMFSNSKIASYLDNEGKMWCFTSDTFKSLLDKKINPYNQKDLPDDFLITLSTQLKVLNDLDIDHGPKYPDLQKITKIDKITNERTDNIKDYIETTLEVYGVYREKLRDISTEMMYTILGKYNMKQLYLYYLNPEHRYATFIRAIKSVTKRNKNISDDIFMDIKNNLIF